MLFESIEGVSTNVHALQKQRIIISLEMSIIKQLW